MAVPPPRAPRRWPRIVLRVVEVGTLLVALGALALWCSVPNTAPLATENPTSTAFIDLRRTQAEAAGKPFVLKWQWKPLGKISRYLRAAVVYAEDDHFYRHDGVDWRAIENAIDRNLDKGALAVGGSTITQQLAKNLYLSPSRSFVRKLRELLIAYALEDHLSKQRILELYLNVVEWGDGVFGAEAAARHWFGHSAQTLTPAEAARLATALPNPFTRSPAVHTPELVAKEVRLIRLLRLQGLIDAAQERTALDAVGASNLQVLPSHYAPDAGDPDAPGVDAPGPITTPGHELTTPTPTPTAPSPTAPTPAPTAPAPSPTAPTPIAPAPSAAAPTPTPTPTPAAPTPTLTPTPTPM